MNVQKMVSTLSEGLIPMTLLIGIFVSYFVGCVERDPILLGFVAQLTGVQSELGVQERNGVQLAVEEINARGGIGGHRVKLVVRDDLGTPEGAQNADRQLIEAGVVAIIGHATSGQTIAGLAVTNPARVVMLSPTATTPELSGKDDYFFRISYSLVDRAQALAQHIYQSRNIARVAIICDADNTAYAKAYLEAFAAKYQSLGGALTTDVNFSSRTQPDFAQLVAQLRANSPDGLLIIAADIDTALIAQRTRLLGWPIPLFATAWAHTETLINNGGQALEGLELEIANTLNNQTPDYLDFKTRYQNRFGQVASFGATSGFEAASVLAAALEKTGGKADGLSQELLNIQNFKGLGDAFSMDKYGDVIRPFHLGTIREGKYAIVKALISTAP